MNKKGLIRILEAIIASVILLTTMSFFFTSQFRPETEDIFLSVQSTDFLASLYENGQFENYVINYDKESMTDLIKTSLPATTGFSMEIGNLVKPKIFIACNCSDINDFRDLMSPTAFTYRGRDIEIFIDNTTLESIRSDSDILLILGYKDLNPYRSQIDDFLESGKTVMMLSDLNSGEAGNTAMMEIFGVEWDGTAPSDPGTFYDPTDPKKESHRISRYFAEITTNYADVTEGNFNNIFNLGGGLNSIKKDNRTIIIDGSTDRSLVKINKNVASNGEGTSVWFADYDRTDPDDNSTKHATDLLKSAIMWSASEKFDMDYPSKAALPPKRMQTTYISAGIGGFFEPYELVLTTWRIFFF